MRRALALALAAALGAPQALPVLPAAPAATESASHHHPPGCPWEGTPRCPHADHGPSADPAWAPCAETPVTVAVEAGMGWAPPAEVVDPAPVPRPAPRPTAGAAKTPSDRHPDVEIPPPRALAAD